MSYRFTGQMMLLLKDIENSRDFRIRVSNQEQSADQHVHRERFPIALEATLAPQFRKIAVPGSARNCLWLWGPMGAILDQCRSPVSLLNIAKSPL